MNIMIRGQGWEMIPLDVYALIGFSLLSPIELCRIGRNLLESHRMYRTLSRQTPAKA
ncbi:hypothetical protein [Paenibacillus sp. NPDC057934]|uniref:hypothetical protein n=1 Tax=Paenibacillus sp. NPDC057934 TaxID=3346282 RepID=UPI0036D8FC16